MLNTPILFLIFNRPKLTKQSFATIKQAKPKQLFMAADGPRKDRPNEKRLCDEARKIIEEIDWECDVRTLFRDENLGCAHAVSTAITWFFEHVEEGIILEDDCIPSPSFYIFCHELLEKYRNTPEVMVITGNNFQNGKKRGNSSYYFSKFNHCWGWATWRKAWQYYDHDMQGDDKSIIRNFPVQKPEVNYWEGCFNATRIGHVDAWDYRWTRSVWSQKGITATPQVNLVSNIGFGEDATHTTFTKSEHANMQALSIEALRHPLNIVQCIEADKYTFDTVFYGTSLKFLPRVIIFMKKTIQKLLMYFGYSITKTGYKDFTPIESNDADIKIIKSVMPYTMTSQERLWALISATNYIVKNNIIGDFVECGVWRGGSTMAMAHKLSHLGISSRKIWLYDTFSGMTNPTMNDIEAISGKSAKELLENNKKEENNIWCIASKEEVASNLQKTGYPSEMFNIVQGDILETLNYHLPEKISLLRLDTDWYESTKKELNILFPRLSKGGVCIIDDYGHWEGSRKAVDEYFHENNLYPFMHYIDHTGRIFIKN